MSEVGNGSMSVGRKPERVIWIEESLHHIAVGELILKEPLRESINISWWIQSSQVSNLHSNCMPRKLRSGPRSLMPKAFLISL